MRRIIALGLALGMSVLAAPAGAQVGQDGDDGSCSYGGRRYASGFAICQAGAVQLCVGGEWQGNGTFCDGTSDGAKLGVPVLGPGQVQLAPSTRPGMSRTLLIFGSPKRRSRELSGLTRPSADVQECCA